MNSRSRKACSLLTAGAILSAPCSGFSLDLRLKTTNPEGRPANSATPTPTPSPAVSKSGSTSSKHASKSGDTSKGGAVSKNAPVATSTPVSTATPVSSNTSDSRGPSGFSIAPFGLGGTAGALIGAITYIIEKHEATVRQKKIAEERARQAYAKMPEQKKATLKKKKVRYIAVDTEKNEKTSPKAKKSVMVWDTESQQMAGSNVYDVEKTPAVGSTTKFEDYNAEYVGSGT